MKYGFPTSLRSKRMPRCKVGSGKNASVYMWKDRSACRFLGGKLFYQKTHVCKAGKAHTWKRVVKCVRGPVLTNKGLNYKTGKKHVTKKHRVVKKSVKKVKKTVPKKK